MGYVITVQCNNLRESLFISDDGPVGPKYVVEFTGKHGLNGDSTNNP
jgi:hypothetical protein